MDSGNVSRVKGMYEAFGRGDIASILGGLAPDVDWRFEGPGGIPFVGCFRGPGEAAMFFDGLGREQDQKLVAGEFVSEGDSVVAVGRYEATVKGGATYNTPFVHLWKFKDGKVTVFRNFVDTARVLAAHTGGR